MTLPTLAWRDSWAAPTRTILLSIGVAVGVAALALILGLSRGVESIVLRKVLGVLPDQIVVEPQTTGIGPLQLATGPALDDPMIARVSALPGVAAVYRRVRVPLPAHINAEYNGKAFYTDALVEVVDPQLVDADVSTAGAFALRPESEPVPVVLPSAMIDVLNMGVSVNTGLPAINPSAIIGRHFTLNIGSSSFRVGPNFSVRCEIVGVSPRVFVGGPSLPLGYAARFDALLKQQGARLVLPPASSLTVMLKSPSELPAVSAGIRALGLAAPQEEKARSVSAVIRAITLMLALFAGVVLVVAGTGIGNGLALMVKDESGEIGLFRAVGASRGQIRALYLMRAAVIGLTGGLAGTLVALLVTYGMNRVIGTFVPGLLDGHERVVALQAAHIIAGLTFGLVASVGAGLIPAQQAARLEPATVLRER